jgi:signal transduction histidine kinase
MRRNHTSQRVFQGPFGVVVSHSVMIVVLLLGLAASVVASAVAREIILRDEQRRFEMARVEADDLVRARFDRFLAALEHTRAFLTTKERVSRQDFRIFLRSVDLAHAYPDLLGIGFSERVSPVHRSAHQRDVREDGYAGYRVWPLKPGVRNYYPVKFIEPFNSLNQRALGFDLHSEARRGAAMDRARDTGEPSLTEPLTLVQDAGPEAKAGFLILLPIYRRGLKVSTPQERNWAIQGFVYAPFRAEDFFRELYRTSAIFHKGIGFRAYAEGGTRSLLFASDTPEGPIHSLDPVNLFGKRWSIDVYTTSGFASPADSAAPLFVFLTGIAITLLAGGVVYATGRHSESQREAIEMRDEFLSICSHELRTPLTSMKLQNQLVQRTMNEDFESGNFRRFEKMVQQSGRQIDRLVRLVEEMLDISRIRSGKLTISPENLDLTQLVHDTVERFAPHLQTVGCSVRVKAPDALPGRWDRMRLEQVLVNLLSNAMKYGAGKPIFVDLERRADVVVLSVRDGGIGIAPEHQARIFERFERAVTKSEISGLGLGLYIAKQILELQGGSIAVESEPGRGSTFTVTLPFVPAVAETVSPKQTDEPEAAVPAAAAPSTPGNGPRAEIP